MRIFVTGTRGIPDIPGGVEKHCQELYPLIVEHGHEVILATRAPYVVQQHPSWNRVQLVHIHAPRKKNLEAIIHTFLAVLKARLMNVDLLHIHAIGPGLMAPFARLLGLRVVITNHGPDYNRGKWGKLAKKMLRLGEFLGGKFANEVIVISRVAEDNITKRCGRASHLIYNGVTIPEKSNNTDFLEGIGIVPGKYLFAVARFVPEKGLHDLLAAFQKIQGDFQLVIAGDADHETDYSRRIKKAAASDKRVILTGYITGESLNQAFSHARLFVLPSYHEGLPIALLEAMSYELPVLVSDIPANKEIALDDDCFFSCGDVRELTQKIDRMVNMELSGKKQRLLRAEIIEKYNWLKIAEQTEAVYKKSLAG